MSGGGEGERVDPGRPGGQVRGGRGDDPGQGQEGGAGVGHPLLHLLQRGRLPMGLGQGHLWSEEGDKLGRVLKMFSFLKEMTGQT